MQEQLCLSWWKSVGSNAVEKALLEFTWSFRRRPRSALVWLVVPVQRPRVTVRTTCHQHSWNLSSAAGWELFCILHFFFSIMWHLKQLGYSSNCIYSQDSCTFWVVSSLLNAPIEGCFRQKHRLNKCHVMNYCINFRYMLCVAAFLEESLEITMIRLFCMMSWDKMGGWRSEGNPRPRLLCRCCFWFFLKGFLRWISNVFVQSVCFWFIFNCFLF